jgi:ATPase subunit of ABC transporter with duplicated ATPase domains
MITINNISKSFGDKILFKNLNLTIYDGEKIGIIGINGSGKSTLLSIIAGKLESDSGNISTNDNICFIEQSREFSEKAYNEVTENIAEKIEFAKTNKQLNLNKNIEFNNDRLKNLSGGEKTKFIISKTFAKSPTTIILDEPT